AFGVDTCGFMNAPFSIVSSASRLIVFSLALLLITAVCACRRGSDRNANANGNAASAAVSDPQQAKRQAQSLVDQGNELYKNDQDEEAVRNYRQATRLKPNDEEAFYQLGMAEIRLAHYPEATVAFQKALELDPDDYRATDAIDHAREGTKRIQEGKKHAEDMLKKQQENANANGNLNSASGKPLPKRSPK